MTGTLVEWAIAALPLGPDRQSGDRHLVKELPNGVLVAAVDGLGHGQEAATAASLAIATLETYNHESLISLVTRCHKQLLGTRGVVMSLGWFDAADSALTWLGVGNVDGTLLRAAAEVRPNEESLLLRGGVVGGQLPLLAASIIAVMPGDMLIFATDGIHKPFPREVVLGDPPQQIANQILAKYSKGTDDALVLVVRYLGHPR